MGEHSADYKPNNRRGIMGSSEERQKEKKRSNSYKGKKGSTVEEYPKMPSGFECFVCGKQFATNEKRLEHLEKVAHGSIYDIASPQERKDTRRLQKTNK